MSGFRGKLTNVANRGKGGAAQTEEASDATAEKPKNAAGSVAEGATPVAQGADKLKPAVAKASRRADKPLT
jgi:hypothetical protein